jgi:hypothetical protein
MARMLLRSENIGDFHLKVSRTEKELYEEFLKTEEAHIVAEMREYFDQAKEKVGGIRFAQKSLWSKIENRVDVWLTDVCGDRHLRIDLTPRAKDAILHRFRTLLAKTIRESLGAK